MIDQNSQFFAILTAVGEAKQANATALGQPWTFSQMGVGDANNADPIPDRTQTRLINEWRRASVNQVRTDPANPNIIITEQVIPADVGGKWIREIALYDADGDMVAVANCAPSFKPLLVQGTGKTQIIRMNFIVANTASVVLKIDPAIVLATREYVDSQIVEAMAKMDFKHSVLVATTASIALSGVQTIDGVLLPADARVLVKNQAAAKENGLYVVSSAGVWKRTQDADTSVEVTPGLFVSVETGTLNGDSVWQLVTDAPIVLDTTALSFEMAVGRTGVSAGSYANVTVDKCGRVIAGTNPSTLAGHGITDGLQKGYVGLGGKTAPVGEIETIALDGGFHSFAGGDTNFGNYVSVLSFPYITADYSAQLGFRYAGDEPTILARSTKASGQWGNTRTLWHSGNFNPASYMTLANGYTRTQVDGLLAPKANWAITLAGYGIGDAYTKTQVDSLVASKAASQEEVDTGSADNKFVPPAKMRFGFAFIKGGGGANNAIVFPTWLGGVMIQWGVHLAQVADAETVVTFPLGFNVTPACVSTFGHDGVLSQSTVTSQVRTLTATGFQSRREDITSTSSFSGTAFIRWIAIGY
ncbi:MULTISPECIES: phage tail protein [unclassified Pseudomonas]|uniref:phage tail protein n=1 Tax=unclassified Pseudomonas TaxID=196821 RepID=UPI0021195C94|nr:MULTISPECIES: phage tail protein [unclassified Pseudomonas]